MPEVQQLQEVPAGLPVLLECQVSPPDAPVRWLKDGEAVIPTEVLAIRSEGCSRRLHIPAAMLSDSGVYTCDAGNAAASFRVTVSGELPGGCPSSRGAHPALWLSPPICPPAEAPVRIVSSNEEAPHTYMAGQRVELWCQLSRPVTLVRWYKDGEEVEAGESLVLEQEGPRHRLVLPCAQPQDTGEFICDSGDASVSYHISVAGWWHSRDVLGRAVLPRLCTMGSPALLPAFSIMEEGVRLHHPGAGGCPPPAVLGWHCVPPTPALEQLLPLCTGMRGCSIHAAPQGQGRR